MEDKINLHIVLTGGSAQLYRMLSDKKAGISYALRLLAQSDVASSMFENMSEVNAFMIEDMKRVEFTPKIDRHGSGLKNSAYASVASTQTENVKSNETTPGPTQRTVPKIAPTPPSSPSPGEEDDDTVFSTGWPQS